MLSGLFVISFARGFGASYDSNLFGWVAGRVNMFRLIIRFDDGIGGF